MSVLRNPVQSQAFAAHPGLIRLLLRCRFDFHHKIWSVPAIVSGPKEGSLPASQLAALLPLLTTAISNFSDPATGGETTRKP
jgi:hypothetical protein